MIDGTWYLLMDSGTRRQLESVFSVFLSHIQRKPVTASQGGAPVSALNADFSLLGPFLVGSWASSL